MSTRDKTERDRDKNAWKGDDKYKFFWQGGKHGMAGVGMLVSVNWIDKVTEVKRLSDRLTYLKLLIGERLVNCYSADGQR